MNEMGVDRSRPAPEEGFRTGYDEISRCHNLFK